MCDTYRYIEISIFLLNIVIQYWLLGESIHWNGHCSKHGFSNLEITLKYQYNVVQVILTMLYTEEHCHNDSKVS